MALTSAVAPAVPLVWSQARKVTEPEVAFWPSGTKRSLSLERRSKAAELLTLPTPSRWSRCRWRTARCPCRWSGS